MHRRGNQWQAEGIHGLESVLSLPEIGVELPLATIYERVNWD